MGIIKRLKWKDKTGKTTDYDLGAKASNVEQDATHRFVSDTEKQTWNGKADPEDIPSGSAADYGVANNDTTNRTDMLVTAQVAYQHGKEIDQLNSDLAESKKWTLLNVAADLEISQEMINTHEEFLITVVSNDTVLGSIILPAWHSIFQSGEYVGKYLHIGGWYHNAANCGMIQIYKFRDIGWTTNPDLHCCSVNGQYVTVNIALFSR